MTRRRYVSRQFLASLALASVVCFIPGCSSLRGSRTDESAAPSNLIVLNAPVDGTVRRVLVSEGVPVGAGAPIIEIAVQQKGALTSTVDPQAQAQARACAAQQETLALEDAVARAAIEVQRVRSLVATGAAPQPQLDAAQAEYQRAQERLQQARAGAPGASQTLSAQRGNIGIAQSITTPAGTIVPVRSAAPGTLRVVSVRPGQQVRVGQPLATISTAQR